MGIDGKRADAPVSRHAACAQSSEGVLRMRTRWFGRAGVAGPGGGDRPGVPWRAPRSPKSLQTRQAANGLLPTEDSEEEGRQAALDVKTAAMNKAQGAEKVDAIAAAVTELVAQHAAMPGDQVCPGGSSMMSGAMKAAPCVR